MAGLLFLFYHQLTAFVEDIDLIKGRLEELFTEFDSFIRTWFGVEAILDYETLDETIFDFIRENAAVLTRGLAGAATILTAAFLIPIYVFLILIFRDFLYEFLLKAFGRNNNEQLYRVKIILNRLSKVVQQYITGICIVIFILAVLNSIVLLIIGVNHAIFFGVFAAMLNVIPFIGPIIGSVLPIIYSLLTMDSLIYPVIILASFYVIQLFESNLFTPVIVGSQVSMNALVTLVLLFTGAQIWGLAGMILFIPLGAMLKVVFDEFDSMKPYGFLLGRVPDGISRKKGPLAKKISEISKVKRKDKTSKSDENKEK